MAFKKDDQDERKMEKVWGFVGKKDFEKLLYFSKLYKLPVTRLIGIAVNNEITNNQEPFKLDLSLPDEFIEYAFAEEAGKILNFMRSLRVGMSLDMLYLLREDIGIKEGKTFLSAFKECVEKNMVESYIAPKSVKYNNSFGDVTLYRSIAAAPLTRKKVAKKAKTKAQEYDEYMKLKKKFEGITK